MPFKYIDTSVAKAASKYTDPADDLGVFGALSKEVRDMIWDRCINDDNSIAIYRTSKAMYHDIASRCDPYKRKSNFTIELCSIPEVAFGGIHLAAKVYDGYGCLVEKWSIEPKSYHVFVKSDARGEDEGFYSLQYRPLHGILTAHPTLIKIMIPAPSTKAKVRDHYEVAALQLDEVLIGLKAELAATRWWLPSLCIHFADPDDTVWGPIPTNLDTSGFSRLDTIHRFSLSPIFGSLNMISSVPTVSIKLPEAVDRSSYWNERIRKLCSNMTSLERNNLERFKDEAELKTDSYRPSKITPIAWKKCFAKMVTRCAR